MLLESNSTRPVCRPHKVSCQAAGSVSPAASVPSVN